MVKRTKRVKNAEIADVETWLTALENGKLSDFNIRDPHLLRAIGRAQIHFCVNGGVRWQPHLGCGRLQLDGRQEAARPACGEQLLGIGAIALGSWRCELHA